MDRKISITLLILFLINTVFLTTLYDIKKNDADPIIQNNLPTIKIIFWIVEILLLIASIGSLLYLDYNSKKLKQEK